MHNTKAHKKWFRTLDSQSSALHFPPWPAYNGMGDQWNSVQLIKRQIVELNIIPIFFLNYAIKITWSPKKKCTPCADNFFFIILKCALIYKYCHIINKRNLDPIRILIYIYIYILLKYDKIVKYSHPRLISLPRSNKIGMGSGYFIFFFYMVYLFLISIFRKRNVQGDWLPRFLSSPSTLITMWCACPFQPKLISIWFLPSG